MLSIAAQPLPYLSAYKPNEWAVTSTKFPVNTTPGETGLPIFLIAQADVQAVQAEPGLTEGDIYIIIAAAPPAGVFAPGQTILLEGTILGRYDGIHRILKAITPSIYVIDATNVDGSQGGTMSKYYERFRTVFTVQFESETEPQQYIVEAGPDGRFLVDIRKQAQRAFAGRDIFDIMLPNQLPVIGNASTYITQRFTIKAQEAFNVPTAGINVWEIQDEELPLPPAQGKFNVAVNSVQPYHHTDEFGGGTDLDWNDEMFPFIVSPTTTGQNIKRFLTYAPQQQGITIAPGEDYFLAWLTNADPLPIKVRLTSFVGTTPTLIGDITDLFQGQSMYIACGPANIGIPTNATSYTVQLLNEEDQPLTTPCTFIMDRECYRTPRRFFALNKLGGMDAFTFTGYEKRDDGNARQTVERSTMPARIPKQGSWMRKTWKNNPLRLYSQTTETLTRPWLRYVADEIFESPDIRMVRHAPAGIAPTQWWTTVIPVDSVQELGFEHGRLRIDYAIGVDNMVQRR